MREPVPVITDHDRGVRAMYMAALEAGVEAVRASRLANRGIKNRAPVDIPPIPTDLKFSPLDLDRNGQPGGSLPADQRGGDIAALRAKAEGLGVTVDKRWGAPRLRKEIEAVQ
jgi:hypothetical protein